MSIITCDAHVCVSLTFRGVCPDSFCTWVRREMHVRIFMQMSCTSPHGRVFHGYVKWPIVLPHRTEWAEQESKKSKISRRENGKRETLYAEVSCWLPPLKSHPAGLPQPRSLLLATNSTPALASRCSLWVARAQPASAEQSTGSRCLWPWTEQRGHCGSSQSGCHKQSYSRLVARLGVH